MIKRMTFILVIVLTVFSSVTIFAVDTYGGYNIPIDIDVNGNFIKCTEKPIMINNTTYIPLRAFSDATGGTIIWDENEMAAIMTKDGHSFIFYPESGRCMIDGIENAYKPMYYNDLTFIPVRAVSETLGYTVNWDDSYLTVKINAQGVVVPENCKDKAYTYEDVKYLGKITQIESGSQSFATKLGVASTVINRVKSSQFPNSVKDVIFDKKYGVQFPPAHTEKINVTPSVECILAAKCALNGINNVRNSLYFIDAKAAKSSWAHKNRPFYTSIGGISFYE